MIYDLHTHSNASDGILTPEALVSRALVRGVTHLAITDHDTLSALPQAYSHAKASGLDLISGIEFSTQWRGRGVHLVGLNMDLSGPSLLAAVHSQAEARTTRALEIARRLEKLGIPDVWAGARQFAGSEALGRPHFAQYLMHKGYVPSMQAAFKKYLGAGKAGDVQQCWLEPEEIVAAITDAGGIAVLAHPLKYSLTHTKLRALVTDFSEWGGQAMEVISGQQNSMDTQLMARVAQQYQLYASCGSDFHVPDRPWQELGAFGKLPESCTPVWRSWQ